MPIATITFRRRLTPTSPNFAQSLTLHTTVGDMKIELFCDLTPRTCENFLALSGSGYYNGTLFHRNIKGFMVQAGTHA